MAKTYKLAKEVTFTKANIENTTILFGNLSEAANRLLEASMRNLGYLTRALPQANLDAFHLGKEYSNKGQCNPVYFTVGNLILYLEKLHHEQGLSREYIANHYAFITAGSCGPCRFGMYESEYRLALDSAGYKNFRIILFQQSLNQDSFDSGLNFDYHFFLTLIEATMLSDHLNEMRYRLEPYEKNAGEVQKVFDKSLTLLCNYLEQNQKEHPFLGSGGLLPTFFEKIIRVRQRKILKQIATMFNEIELQFSQSVPVVKVTGEFWAQTTEGDGNFKMFSFLKQEGAEVMVEPLSSWLAYLLWLEIARQKETRYTNKRGKRVSIKKPLLWLNSRFDWFSFLLEMRFGLALFHWRYKRLGRLLGNFTRPLVSMDLLAKLSKPFVDSRYDGGEGHLEVAKNIYYSENKLAHMVLSVKPFGCMPSTISDSVQSKVVEHFSGMTFLPIETSGEGKVNAYSRVQMQLTQARTKARAEVEAQKALQKNNARNKKKKTIKAKKVKHWLKAAGSPTDKLARAIKHGITNE